MFLKRFRKFVFVLLVFVLVASACGPAQEATPTEVSEAEETEMEEEEATPVEEEEEEVNTLVVAMPSTPPTLDNEFVIHPMVLAFQPNVYDTLIEYDTHFSEDRGIYEANILPSEFVPQLAESWDVSDDGTTYTFHLRDGVESCYGNEMSAEDVLWTYERKLTLGGNSLLNMHLAGIRSMDQITAPDEDTIQITIDEPRPLFLQVHTLFFSNSVWDTTEVKKHTTDDDPYARDWLETHAAGFGPYCVEEFTAGQQLVLTANPGYWGEAPYFDRVIWREVPESSNRLALLLGGDVDIAYGLTPRQRNDLEGVDDVKIAYSPSNNFMEIAFNNQIEPFGNETLRKALAYAVPYKDILDTVYFGDARLRKSIVPDIYPGYTDEYWDYNTDLDKAEEMLAEAGYPDGLEITLAYDVVDPEAEQIAVLVKSNWDQIGAQTTLNRMPSANFADQQGSRDLPAFIWSEQPIYPDPIFATWLWFHDDNFPAWSEYKNEEMEQLFEEAMSLTGEERLEAAREIQQIIMEDMPVIPLVERGWYLPMGADIEGYTWYPDNTTHFEDLHREQ